MEQQTAHQTEIGQQQKHFSTINNHECRRQQRERRLERGREAGRGNTNDGEDANVEHLKFQRRKGTKWESMRFNDVCNDCHYINRTIFAGDDATV